jgi:hypothetical protein
MGTLYVTLVDAGFDPAYLDQCTLLDLDLFTRHVAEFRKKQGPKLF